MFLEKIKLFAEHFPESLPELNHRIIEVTDELVQTIEFINFNDCNACQDLLEVLQILEFCLLRGKRERPSFTVEVENDKLNVFNSIKISLYRLSLQQEPAHPKIEVFLSNSSIVTLCQLYLIEGVLDGACYQKLEKVLLFECNHENCPFVVWCLLVILKTSVSINVDNTILPSWIPRQASNTNRIFCDFDRILEILPEVAQKFQSLGTPPLETFFKIVRNTPKLMSICDLSQHVPVYILDIMVDILDSPKFLMKHVQKLTELTEILSEKNLNEVSDPKFSRYRKRISHLNRVRQEYMEFKSLVREVDPKNPVKLDLLSKCFQLLKTVIYDETKKDVVNLAQVLFKTPSNRVLILRLEKMIRNNARELNSVLDRHHDHEWLHTFLATYPNLLSFDANINYIQNILTKNDDTQMWQLFAECFSRLKCETKQTNVEKYTNAAKSLFKALVIDEESRKTFAEFAEQNKSTVNQCFGRHDVLTDFLFSIFRSNTSFIAFDLKINNITRVIQYFDKTEQLYLLFECRRQFENGTNPATQEKLAIAYFSLLSAQNYSDDEFAEITDESVHTINRMLITVVNDSKANKFYSMLLRNKKLLNLDIRVKYYGRELVELSEDEQMEFLFEMLQELDHFDDSKNMFDYLAAVEILLSGLLKTEYNLDDVKVRISKLVEDHMRPVNEALMIKQGFQIFSKGALLSIFKLNPTILELDVKLKYIDLMRGKENENFLWHVLGESLKAITNGESLTFEEKICKYLWEIDRDEKLQKDFVEQNKFTVGYCMGRLDLLTDFLYSIIGSYSQLIPFGSKLNNIQKAVKYFPKSELQNLLYECLEQFQCFDDNLEEQREIATAFFSLLVALNYREDETTEIIANHSTKISNMLFQITNNVQAKNYYSMFLKNQKLLSVDVRVKYFRMKLINLNEYQQRGLLIDMVPELEKFDDSKNMFDYLVALEMVLGTLFSAGYSLRNDTTKILGFAASHIKRVNEEMRKDEGFAIFSKGALLSILKKNTKILEIDVKCKYIECFGGKENESHLWHFLGEYLKNIETNESKPFEVKICKLLREIDRNVTYQEEFVVDYKTVVNGCAMLLSIRNSPLRSLLLPIPGLVTDVTKNMFQITNGVAEQCEWLGECLTQFKIMQGSKTSLLKMIEEICGLINANGGKGGERLKDIIGKHTKLIADKILTRPNTKNVETLVFREYPKALSFQRRLEIIQNESKLRVNRSFQVKVNRENVLGSSFELASKWTDAKWKNKFKIVFNDEPGVDAGGLLREWFTITTREILDPNFGWFIPTPGDPNSYMINKSSHINQDYLKVFKFIGRFLAKGILENISLDCPLTKVLYKLILDKKVMFSDFKSQDPEFFNSLRFILNNSIDEAGLDLTFSAEIEHFGAFEERELIDNGKNIPVTDENKKEYVKLVSEMKMIESIRPQLKEFLAGFYSLIPKELIIVFDEKELELLLCGQSEIDIEDLNANTTYSNYQESDDVIQWFWDALQTFDKDDKARFLMFVTGSAKAPLNGFAELQGFNGLQKFNISADLVVGDDRLPTANTCFNRLNLPRYQSFEVLHEKLLLAIQEGTEGFGME